MNLAQKLLRRFKKATEPEPPVPPLEKSPELKRLDKKVLKEKGEI
jgi:hypothetical protein